MRALHSDADIVAAGQRLQAERPGPVTPWDVLKGLGNRGKLDRIARIWAAHLEGAEEVAVAPATVETPLPPRLAEARDADLTRVDVTLDAVRGVVAALYSTTWSVADEVAQGRVAGERKAFSDQRQEFERREGLAREIQAAAEDREDALETKVERLDGELAEAKTATTQLTERLAAIMAEGSRAAERSAAEIGRLTSALAASEASVALARQEAAGAAATAAASQAEAERARAEIVIVRGELEGVRSARDGLATRLAAVETQLSAAGEDLVRERDAKAVVETRERETAGKLGALADKAARAEEKVAAGETRASLLEARLSDAGADLVRERDARVAAEGRAMEASKLLATAEARAAVAEERVAVAQGVTVLQAAGEKAAA